jgi:hypothetical protein
MGKVRRRKCATTLKRLFRGHPQRDYSRHQSDLDYIFTRIFPRWTPTSYLTVTRLTGIPFQRLYAWKSKWTEGPNWSAYTYELRGLHHRVFTKEEEQALAYCITLNYVLPGYLFTNATFRRIAIQAYLEKHQQDEIPREFECSAGFIAGFQARNNFASRRSHLKRRPAGDARRKRGMDWQARSIAPRCERSQPDH